MDKPKFVYVTHINTTPEKLWDALTKPEFTQQFYGGRKIRSKWTVGSPIEFIRPDGGIELHGEVTEIEPLRLLRCRHLAGVPPEKPSRLTFEISLFLGVTTLTITHDDFAPDSKVLGEVSRGWQIMASTMKTFLETGKPLPFAMDQQPGAKH